MKRRLRYASSTVARALRGRRPLSSKQHGELDFWRHEIERYVAWHEGRLDHLWGVPSPRDRIHGQTGHPRGDAILAWARAGVPEKYLSHLLVPGDHFAGMTVLDVGCGPIPYALGFSGCQVVGLDELVDEYRGLGFPLEEYPDRRRLTYVRGSAEQVPAADDSFDAVISVNALDHLRDFPAAAGEICRVLRPGGIVRFQVHYHPPTPLEPWALNDDLILEHLGALGVEKVHEMRATDLPNSYPDAGTEERQVVWANDGYVAPDDFGPLVALSRRQRRDDGG